MAELVTGDILMPCPFCGCEAHIGQWRDTMKPNTSWVECMNLDCMAATQTYHDPDPDAAKRKAVAAWNRRTQPQSQAIIDFVDEVCAMAEQKMMITHKLEGAHYASMMELAKRYGYETNRNVKLVAAPSVSVLRGSA